MTPQPSGLAEGTTQSWGLAFSEFHVSAERDRLPSEYIKGSESRL